MDHKYPDMVPPEKAALVITVRLGGAIRTPDQALTAIAHSIDQRYGVGVRNPFNELPGIPANIIHDADGNDVGQWEVKGV